MEHIEEAGVHSGDSACSLPPFSLRPRSSRSEAPDQGHGPGAEGPRPDERAVRHRGRSDDRIFVLEVNPRASRTVPFVAKAIGLPIAAIAAKVMAGVTLRLRPGRQAVRPYRGQGSGLPFRPLPRRRHHPGPRDALDRRGHGPGLEARRARPTGPGLRPRLRQEPDRRRHQAAPRAACSSRSRTPTSP